MAKFKGTNSADTFDGTLGKDKIFGFGGNDILNGHDGNDFISGGNGDDVLNGGAGNDHIDGGKGNDTISGGAGNDTIDGGKGIDTVLFSGAFDDYVIDDGHGHHGHGYGHGHGHGCGDDRGHHESDDKLTVRDTVAGRDGFDHIDNAEFLQFMDASVNVNTGAVAQWHYAVDALLDASAQDPGQAPGYMYAGTGLNAAHFGTARNEDAGVELGLKVHHRSTVGNSIYLTTDDYNDGVLHYEVQQGPAIAGGAPKAEWSFDFSIATGLNGETTNLGDFTFKMLYDVDPSAAVSYKTLVLEAEGTPQGADQSGFQWRDVDTGIVFVNDDEGNANVTQNSRNYGFAEFQSFLTDTYGPGNNFAGPAHFDIQLQAFDGLQMIAQNHIAVDVIL